jgi:beta-glucosidase
VPGAEVAQLYLTFPTIQGIDFPPKQLRGFDKVLLRPGETKIVKFELRVKDLSYWHTASQSWRVVDGKIGVKVAGGSRAKGVESVLR